MYTSARLASDLVFPINCEVENIIADVARFALHAVPDMTVVATLQNFEAPLTIAFAWMAAGARVFVLGAIEIDVFRVTHAFCPS